MTVNMQPQTVGGTASSLEHDRISSLETMAQYIKELESNLVSAGARLKKLADENLVLKRSNAGFKANAARRLNS